MELETVRQIRGAKELVEEAVDAATLRICEVQRVMTRKPYAVHALIPPPHTGISRIGTTSVA